jgi:hypothetical protein
MLAAAGMSLAQSGLAAKANAKRLGDEAYATRATYLGNRLRSQLRIDAATKNISAVRKDKVLHNMAIDLRQMEAEAQAKVSAAVAGVEGNSVKQVEYQTEVNAALASDALDRQSEDEELGYIAQLFGASYDISQPYKQSSPPNMLPSAILGAGQSALNAWSIE